MTTEQSAEPKQKRKYTKKDPGKKWSNRKSVLNAEHSSLTFLFFIIGDEEYTIPVSAELADQRALEIFADQDYDGPQQIYFMKITEL